MTKERRENVLLVALVCSIALHVGLMFAIRAQVMTQASAPERTEHTAPMRVRRAAPHPDPVKIEEILDLKALKDAPAAVRETAAPRAEAPSASARLPEPSSAPEMKAPAAPMPVFETKAVSTPATAEPLPQVLATPVVTRPAAADKPSAPEFSVRVSAAPHLPAPDSHDLRTLDLDVPRTFQSSQTSQTFQASSAVYDKVDEAVVAAEKAAVRELVNADRATDLVKFVNLTMTATEADGWRYFKVMMTPRASLKTVPKDVVILIDGSGSIGNDRLGSCRKAARRIMRSCLNSGDRFNLVVFRNAFSYAFRSWRDCDAASFEAGDRWLGNQTAHGRTDVFSTISSVLTLPRDPTRPLVALVVTDGDANTGVSDTAEILSKFTALNDGLVSIYMYGVKSSANRELIDVLTHGNRGESFVFEGWRWSSGEGMEELSERFRDPVLSDLRLVFASSSRAEAYPRLLRNLYRGGTLEFVGRVPSGTKEVAFSLRGLNGAEAYESFFRLPFVVAPSDPSLVALWQAEAAIDRKLGSK